MASWLGVESGVDVDIGVHEHDDRAPLTSAVGRRSGGGGGSGGSTVNEMTPFPPFKAADLEGLRLETWLLEVSFGRVCCFLLGLEPDLKKSCFFFDSIAAARLLCPHPHVY